MDDTVVFGSPGLMATNVDQLRVESGKGHVIEARNDVVADLGGTAPFGTDPTWLRGTTHLSSSAGEGGGQPLQEVTGHSSYFDERSTSQYNLATVVAGNTDHSVRGGNNGFGDIRSFPIYPFGG